MMSVCNLNDFIMPCRINKKNRFSLLLALLAMAILQVACTADNALDQFVDHSSVEVVKVDMGRLESGLTYPVAIVEKSIEMGLGEPYFLPDYNSPNQELFTKFQTKDNFEINIDGEQVNQEELLSSLPWD